MTHSKRYCQEGHHVYNRMKWGNEWAVLQKISGVIVVQKLWDATFKKWKSHSGVYYQKCCMQDKEGNYSALLVPSERAWFLLWAQHLKKHGHREYPPESKKRKFFKKRDLQRRISYVIKRKLREGDNSLPIYTRLLQQREWSIVLNVLWRRARSNLLNLQQRGFRLHIRKNLLL